MYPSLSNSVPMDPLNTTVVSNAGSSVLHCLIITHYLLSNCQLIEVTVSMHGALLWLNVETLEKKGTPLLANL